MKSDVDTCCEHIEQYAARIIDSSHEGEVKISKELHKYLQHTCVIPCGGAAIRRIRNDTNTRIDFPNGADDSDVIHITGKRKSHLHYDDTHKCFYTPQVNISASATYRRQFCSCSLPYVSLYFSNLFQVLTQP